MERNKDEATSSQPLPSPCPSRPETFWSSRSGCGMQYEYLRMYLNQNLIHPNCLLPFLVTVTEKPAPSSGMICSTPGGPGSATFTPDKTDSPLASERAIKKMHTNGQKSKSNEDRNHMAGWSRPT
ncbi:Hypothetical predicted protein [Olea europaea subsp. europaea]|uniref:Zinc beta-ribbon domain-containing protein n=1 Tax=Olea europaea subsp. europaea TaxID=158383 RepID=A0A8S0PNP8_OLEEU|nr:Hypothetical predicted protein [Olea europaea subsp. europaea]